MGPQYYRTSTLVLEFCSYENGKSHALPSFEKHSQFALSRFISPCPSL